MNHQEVGEVLCLWGWNCIKLAIVGVILISLFISTVDRIGIQNNVDYR